MYFYTKYRRLGELLEKCTNHTVTFTEGISFYVITMLSWRERASKREV